MDSIRYEEGAFLPTSTFRAVDIRVPFNAVEHLGFWQVVWGTDLFINNIPVMKGLVLMNIIVWIIMYLCLR